MTLAALREELQDADREAFDYITTIQWGLGYSIDNPITQAIIQGCIQRACERRGWPVVLSFDCDPDHPQTWVAEICDGWALLGMAVGHESPSEALLTAYIAAIREEDKHVNNTCNNKGNDGTL